jgi:hypothetical protein
LQPDIALLAHGKGGRIPVPGGGIEGRSDPGSAHADLPRSDEHKFNGCGMTGNKKDQSDGD